MYRVNGEGLSLRLCAADRSCAVRSLRSRRARSRVPILLTQRRPPQRCSGCKASRRRRMSSSGRSRAGHAPSIRARFPTYDQRRRSQQHVPHFFDCLRRSEYRLQLLTNTIYRFKRVRLEAGPLSQWLYSVLAEAGLPVICVETRHMRAVLKAQINKTDRNDARGTAQMIGRDYIARYM